MSSLVLIPVLTTLALAQIELPGTSSVTVPFAAAEACRSCHGGFDVDESAFDTWAGSAMAHAAQDPLFLSALVEAEKDLPGVGDYCLRCHAPAAWLEGRCFPTDGSALEADDTGVSCTFCHRLDDSEFNRNGQWQVADAPEYRGPYPPATAKHRVVQSTYLATSRMCSTCHELWNPLVPRVAPEDGAPMDMQFPEQTTYTEWNTSAFADEGVTCQSCHMPESEGRVADEGPVRPDRSRHAFAGGNAFLLGALAFLEPGLGLSQELRAGQARVQASLREAAELAVVGAPSLQRGEEAAVTIRVTNLTGHKLPTGYPEGRRVWLSVRASALSVDLGRFDAVTGEPREPAALYHAIHGRYGVGPGHRIALNDTIYFDNRIPPRGMVATSTTAPVGKTYPEVAPGVLAHYDDVVVTALVPCDAGDLVELRAGLWYQSVTKRYVDALVAENGNHPHAFRLAAAFEETDPGPFEMETLTLTLPVTGACGGPDAGVVDTGVADQGTYPDASSPADASVAQIDAGTTDPGDEGCGCRASYGRRPDGVSWAALLFLILLGRARARIAKPRHGGH